MAAETKIATILHMSFSIAFLAGKLLYFDYINSHWGWKKIAIILQMTISNQLFLYGCCSIFILKKSLWDRDESGHHFSDDWVLWVLESLTVPFLPLVIITVSLIGHYSFQPGCHRSHMAVSNTLRPRLNGPLFSSHLFKIPDLSIMNPSEYELPNNLMNIILCPVMLCRRHKICI